MFKYGLQTLLFVILCVAGFLGAYRVGLDRGFAGGLAKWRGEQYLPRVYFVKDLAGAGGSYSRADIENTIKQIDPACWDFAGGPASLQVLVDRNRNPVLVISADSGLHDRVEAVLQELRASNELKVPRESLHRIDVMAIRGDS
jgi:hypothetical protein